MECPNVWSDCDVATYWISAVILLLLCGLATIFIPLLA